MNKKEKCCMENYFAIDTDDKAKEFDKQLLEL